MEPEVFIVFVPRAHFVHSAVRMLGSVFYSSPNHHEHCSNIHGYCRVVIPRSWVREKGHLHVLSLICAIVSVQTPTWPSEHYPPSPPTCLRLLSFPSRSTNTSWSFSWKMTPKCPTLCGTASPTFVPLGYGSAVSWDSEISCSPRAHFSRCT